MMTPNEREMARRLLEAYRRWKAQQKPSKPDKG